MTTNINSVNPGGRLHDDFSGPNNTKDIYVENYGDQNIYARVRLDEYMEVGDGAGKYTITETNGTTTKTKDAENKAVSLVEDATYEDETTWTTHIPGESELGDGAEQGFADSDETFHKYWKWTFGGSTTYMPTFNKDNTSLAADINGTYGGKTDTTGHYDDYVDYNTDEYKDTGKIATATYASETAEETHTAQETLTASVITMATYNSYPDTSEEEGVTTKKNFIGWVYDTDGWAYWSQAIEPGTATGLLLDKVENATKNGIQFIPQKKSFYAINVIGEFITADDIGSAKKGDGFYSNGSGLPSSDALALLSGIGVEIGKVTLSKVTTSGNTETLTDIKDQVLTMLADADGTSFTAEAAISTPMDGGTWTWTSSDSSIVAVTADSSDSSRASVAVVSGNTELGSITITADYTDSSGAVIATASFIANVPKTVKVGQTVTLDGVNYTVMAVSTVTGRSATETETEATPHSAALLLRDSIWEESKFGDSNSWKTSAVRNLLKDQYGKAFPEAAGSALEVTLSTYDPSSTAEDHRSDTQDTFFVLSEADVTGKATKGSVGNAAPESWEYTAGAKLPTLKALGGRWLIYHTWLRTPDRSTSNYSLYIQNTTTGTVRRVASTTTNASGGLYIRPAFWYDLGAVSTGSD